MKHLMLAAFGVASLASASTIKIFEPEVGLVLGKVAECLPEFEEAVRGASSVGEVKFVSPKPASPKIRVDTYVVETVVGTEPFATLSIVETTDFTSTTKITYDCKLVKH